VSHTPLLSGGASLVTSSSSTFMTLSCAPCHDSLPFDFQLTRYLQMEEGFCSFSAETVVVSGSSILILHFLYVLTTG
jgi:hypothetical protein